MARWHKHYCRMAAAPYPAYKRQACERKPGKRSVPGKALGR
ncbi:hypothetical protein [Salmonella enterica]|nr:hypothetical protein [Salmonella enterica]